jgi:hypothetical protein
MGEIDTLPEVMFMKKPSRLLRIGLLGSGRGAVAQVAHLEACRNACNIKLSAICDRAEDLVVWLVDVTGGV